jgi:hypothetical protein
MSALVAKEMGFAHESWPPQISLTSTHRQRSDFNHCVICMCFLRTAPLCKREMKDEYADRGVEMKYYVIITRAQSVIALSRYQKSCWNRVKNSLGARASWTWTRYILHSEPLSQQPAFKAHA